MIPALASGEVHTLHVWPGGEPTPHAVDEMLLGIDALAPGTIADNICTTGILGLTALPVLTRLVFADPDDPASDGVVIVLGGENMPCTFTGALVGDRYGTPPEKFPKASIHLRGVTGWVERPGVLRAGTAVRAVPPRTSS